MPSYAEVVAFQQPIIRTEAVDREITNSQTSVSFMDRRAPKARGTVLGGKRKGAANIAKHQRKGVEAAREKAVQDTELGRDALEALIAENLTITAMAARLNGDSVTTSRGAIWTATAVKRALHRLRIAQYA